MRENYGELDQWGPIDARLLYPSFWFTPLAKYSCWPEMLMVFDHDRMVFYWKKREMQVGGELALREILNPNKREKLWQEYVKLIKLMQSASRRGSISDKQWYDYLILFWRITMIAETANFAAPLFLKKKISKLVPPEKIDKVMEILLAPEKLSFHQQGELSLLKAGDFKKYARQWYWLENSYYESKILTADYFASRMKFLSLTVRKEKIKKILNYTKEVRRRKSSIIKKYDLPQEIITQAEAMAFSIWWQDHRKSIVWQSNSITDKINKKLSLKFNLSEDDLLHYTAEEWVRLNEKNVQVAGKIIKQRKKFAIFEFLGRGYKIYYDKQARKVMDKWLPKEKKWASNKILKGVTVSTGQGKKARGRVCLLLSPRFIKKMRRHDILVAPMTSPDYIQAMRLAKAIITDVGGLMSHAAVVSRELGIPCIVNTKIATKILKDGMTVEVDANNGIVRIIK